MILEEHLKVLGHAPITQTMMNEGNWECLFDLLSQGKDRGNYGFLSNGIGSPLSLLTIRV